MSQRHFLGKKGELIARAHLMKTGMMILEQGWRDGRNEIDLIGKEADTVVIVEVKTRHNGLGILPDLQLSPKQADRIHRSGMAYLEQSNHSGPFRFDLIAIEWYGNGSYRLRHLVDLDFSG